MILYISSVLLSSPGRTNHFPICTYRYEEYSLMQKLEAFLVIERAIRNNPDYSEGNATVSTVIIDTSDGDTENYELNF
jgi:hypothetical protein